MSIARKSVRLLAMAAAPAALTVATPAHASLVLVGTFSGNQCTGGGITTCYANYANGTASLTQVGANGTPVPGSAGILGLDNTGSTTGFTDSLSGEILTYNYTGSEPAYYMGIFNGGSAVGCTAGVNCFNNTYLLFQSSTPITSGTIDLSAYFKNSGISHVDLFDHGAVPEPAAWAMMLVGFGGIAMAMRRRRKGTLMQVA